MPQATAVKNARPGKSYYLQSMADQLGASSQQENGWEIVLYTKGGPIVGPSLNTKEFRPYRDGDLIVYRGHMLMEADTAEVRRQRAEGSVNGTSLGEQHYDRQEDRILSKRALDKLRGHGIKGTSNEIQGLEPEMDI